jgi:hypothetical protein
MPDKKITEWYTANPVTLDPGDIIPVTENTGATPATGAFKVSQLMFNRYKIVPTVAANNLTLALKHEDGNDASADRPLYFKIGNAIRAVTGSLSVTVNAGTSTFNAGAAEFAATPIQFFPYVSYRTASTAVVLGCSRIPYATLYSDFSGTATNEKYAAFSTAPAATDDVMNIGRFEATNSGTASYNWSVPTFTSQNLRQYPIYQTDWLTWIPTLTGFSSAPTNSVYLYRVQYNTVTINWRNNSTGTSTSSLTTFTGTLPFTAKTIANMNWHQMGHGTDNNVSLTTSVLASIASAGSIVALFSSPAAAAWTAASVKRATFQGLMYEI